MATSLAASSLCLLVPITAAMMAAWLGGWQLHSVETASMEPTYPVGSMLVVEPFDASGVQAGMAVVFEDPERQRRLVAHRVIEVLPSTPPQFCTQGDANNVADAFPVPGRYVRGRVRWQINHAGAMLEWLQWPRNAIVLIGVPVMLLLLGEGREVRRRRVLRRESSPPGHRCPWCGSGG